MSLASLDGWDYGKTVPIRPARRCSG